MTTEPTRYSLVMTWTDNREEHDDAEMKPDPSGDYVTYTDFAALKAERDRIEAAYSKLSSYLTAMAVSAVHMGAPQTAEAIATELEKSVKLLTTPGPTP